MSRFDQYNIKDLLPEELPKGFYQLRVDEAEVDEWDDGRLRVDIKTKVVGGEQDGQFGPRKTYSFGGYEGETKDGREFSISAEEQDEAFDKGILLIRDGKPPHMSGDEYNEKTLKEIVKQLKGQEFIGRVSPNEEGYPQLRRMWPMSAPPKAFKNGSAAKAKFSLDEV